MTVLLYQSSKRCSLLFIYDSNVISFITTV